MDTEWKSGPRLALHKIDVGNIKIVRHIVVFEAAVIHAAYIIRYLPTATATTTMAAVAMEWEGLID